MKSKIRNFLFPVMLLFSFYNSSGQTVFPSFTDGAQWNVLECFWYNCATTTYQYSYDTAFCNQTYSKISMPFTQSAYIRSDNFKTYFRRSTNCNSKEYLLYDYSLGIGDTTYVGLNQELNLPLDTAAFVLIQIDTINYFGVDRQRFKMNYDRCSIGFFADTMYWIRGIGAETHPFYSLRCLCDFCEYNFALLCYDSTSIKLYQNNFYNTCDTTISVGMTDIPSSRELLLGPNPFKEHTVIGSDNFQSMNVKVFNSAGQIVKIVEKATEVIFGDDFQHGIYYAQIQTTSWNKVIKLVKL